MASSFVRLDKLLVDRGLCPSRERAQALILAARVLVNGQRVAKAGQKVSPVAAVELQGDDIPYVSRGGLKLEHAIREFHLDLQGLVAMDVGASTGGFTDCLLQHQVKRVYAVDVGYGQLAWKLRQDPRVVVLERANIRHLPTQRVPELIQVAVIDTSFISLRIVIPAVLPFLDSSAVLIALIKPQFEAGRERVGKGGVVRDPAVHEEVCSSIARACEERGFETMGITPSPILGAKGNREFLMACTRRR
ncbi:MAG: TlyA family RNA methyltransferase [Deltaproteobacteria bacterium]|nr:TlyA family RNA methyltransferase [Deltaproteobacteria bacterium]